MKSEAMWRVIDRVLKRQPTVKRNQYADGATLIEDLMEFCSPFKKGHETDLFEVAVVPDKDALVIRITGKNQFGKAAVMQWSEDAVAAEFQDPEDE